MARAAVEPAALVQGVAVDQVVPDLGAVTQTMADPGADPGPDLAAAPGKTHARRPTGQRLQTHQLIRRLPHLRCQPAIL